VTVRPAGQKAPVIAVDGPSGVGKGDVSQFLASSLGWCIMDSGALYRILAYKALEIGVRTDDVSRLCELAADLEVSFAIDGDALQVIYEGADIGDAIRRENVGVAASQLAVWPEVRRRVVRAQRRQRRSPGLVADGRDMGTEVFPDADLKLFLEASVEARANRRFQQLKALGFSVSLGSLLQSISRRDEQDRTRKHSPLIAAQDAIVINTTRMGREAVRSRVLEIVRDKALDRLAQNKPVARASQATHALPSPH